MENEQVDSGEQTTEAAAPVAEDHTDSMDTEQRERNVPLAAVQAERAERQKLQDEVRMLKEHLSIVERSRQAPQKEEEPEYSKDDVITYGELEKLFEKKERQYQMTIEELRMTQKYPDYAQVVTQYLPEVIKENPGLRDTLQRSQDYELAYYLAKNSDVYKAQNKKAKKNADAEKIVQNASRAGSLSSVGQTSPISEAKRYKSMSDTDFMKEVQKNLGYY